MSTAASLVLGPVLVVPAGPAGADAAGRGGHFVPVNTVLLDTRSGVGGVTGARGAASTTTFTALGVGGVPTSGVRALLIDVTAVTPSGNTYLTVFPNGETRPIVASLNVSKDEVLTNSVVVAPAATASSASTTTAAVRTSSSTCRATSPVSRPLRAGASC